MPVICRIDTVDEVAYYRHGGILQYVLRGMAERPECGCGTAMNDRIIPGSMTRSRSGFSAILGARC